MKKMIRTISVLVLTVVVLGMITAPAMAASFPFNQSQMEKTPSRNEILDTFEDMHDDFDFDDDDFEDTQNAMEVVVIVIFVLAVGFCIAEIVYIFVTAPKCGMSRFWALVPLFSNFFGLIVFIMVRSSRMTSGGKNTVICPTCNCVHPCGTTVCSICGAKF